MTTSSSALTSQIVISNGRGGQRYMPYAFTEHGVVMHDQNDINEAHRIQLEAISLALSELQMQKRLQKPRRRIGYDVKPDEEYIE